MDFSEVYSIGAFNLKCSMGRGIEEAVESEGSASSTAKHWEQADRNLGVLFLVLLKAK